ncbi:hypothetical protein BJ322DRAFT_1025249 [Thelephora terrestris]|uniref:Uncharacterized protein n=1 Tax=Thelephora terrestris TaxID=56493 RepID=A0A9P6L151_9AGAM|nr:hypothetical protein BJ322DRAFT_1025249 [Thelephora terrestris]
MSVSNPPQQTEGNAQRPRHMFIDALKAYSGGPLKDATLKQLWYKARWLSRLMNPFKGVEECFMVAEGSEEGLHLQAEQVINRLSRHERAVRQQQKVDWNKVKSHIPNTVDEVMGTEAETMTLAFFKFLQAGINSSRGDDTKDLKPVILDLIPQRYLSGPTNEHGEKCIWNSVSTSAKNEKGARGFTNKVTACLLCPIDYLQAFDANPTEFVFSLVAQNGSFSRLDREGVPKFPSFMYNEDMIEPGKLTNGLFRGPLLVAVYMFIFVSKRVAKGEKKRARKGIAETHQMENVDPATICYAVLQTWVGISDMSEWSKTDRGVDLSMLYTALRQLLGLERGRDPWVDVTLDWWDSQVKTGGTSTQDRVTRDTEAPSVLETLEIERRQRMATLS